MPLYIPILLATGREGRESEAVAMFVFQEAKAYGFEAELLDVRDFILEGRTARLGKETQDEKSHRWSDIMKRADGLVIVSPEYNHSYPGELKMMLDQLYEEYNRKPIGICAVSAGGLGGARMVEQLRLVSIELQMVPIRNAVYFSFIGNLFDEQGAMKDEHRASYRNRLKGLFDELAWYGEALKKARERSG